MSYPKQPGQDAEAHSALAVRHLEVLKQLGEARGTIVWLEARIVAARCAGLQEAAGIAHGIFTGLETERAILARIEELNTPGDGHGIDRRGL